MSLALIKRNIISQNVKTMHRQTQKPTNQQRNTNEPKQSMKNKIMKNLAMIPK